MSWARPDLLALLLLVGAVAVGGVLAERARRRTLATLAALDTLPVLVPPGVARARGWQVALATVATLGLVLAAAGPRLGFEWQQQTVEGVSIVVVLDVSRSMDAQDVTPSRIERARREIVDLAGLLRGDSVGLVIFAAGPYVRIPLTVDYDTFLWAVNDSSSDTIRAQGSSLAGALDAATGLLEGAEGTGKAIVVVSDGEGHDPSAELDAALERARAVGARIYALGVGEPGGAPIPLATGGFKKDDAGNVVLTRLDEAALQRLAAATGGAYVRAVPSDADVRALYVDEIRGKLDAAERGVRREKLWHERFQWPLGIALAAMAVSAALGIGRRRRAVPTQAAALVLGALLLAHSSPAWAGPAEDGYAALRAQQWTRAAELLGQARVDDPGNVAVTQGLAEALYRSGRYREAEQLFRTLAAQDPANEAVHLYNAGNAAYRGGRLADALKSFQGAVDADPNMKAAQGNATAVEKEIAARTSTPPPEDPQGEGSQGEQGQDGQAQAEPQAGEPSEGQDGQPQEGQPQQGQQGEQQPQDGQASEDGEPGDPPDQGQPGGGPPDAQQQTRPGEPGDAAEQGARPTDDDGGRREGAPPEGTPGEPGA
ncbi:MAG: VWA domain-containing protein, partial [Myxococcota bacterium]